MSSAPSRQVARRVFAAEFNDATHTFKEDPDDDMAPSYALLPTGQRANRVFAVGTLTEANDIGDDGEYWQARVVDPSGVFYIYAGQYQPEVMGYLRNAEPPVFVSVTGKPRTYERDDGSVNVTMRPERMLTVDAETKRNWVVETAIRTMDRLESFNDTDPQSDAAEVDIAQAYMQYGGDVSDYVTAVDDALETLED